MSSPRYIGKETDHKWERLLQEDMKRLGGDNSDPKKMDDDVFALFVCPLIYMSDDVTDPGKTGKVVAVLFADSTKAGAFDEETVTQIVAACEEFGLYLRRIARSEAPELISVKSQATCYLADDSVAVDDFSLLTASPARPPRVPVEYINLIGGHNP